MGTFDLTVLNTLYGLLNWEVGGSDYVFVKIVYQLRPLCKHVTPIL